MKDEKRSVTKITALVLSLTLSLCVFSSCKSKAEEEEITRGSEPISGPASIEQTSNYYGEVTTDPAATKNQTTSTTAKKSDPATAKGTQQSGGNTPAPSVTVADPEAQKVIEEAARQQGKDPSSFAQFVNTIGYDYDPKQQIFYTSYDNWQRQGNFVALYDSAAHYVNMNYRTVRIDFGPSEGLNWRMQLWKGQYGTFGGCEAGIYTADPEKNKMVYAAADNEHLLQWESALYLNKADYVAGKKWFYREWQSHWWLTGFKAGVVDPTQLIMYLRVRMRSVDMADKFETGLLNAGFNRGDAKTQYDTYKRSLNDFYLLWDSRGELNY